MVARGKVVTAKWGVPSTEPDDLPDFLSNEEIVDKMGGEPKGVFRVQIKKITVVNNKNGDPMLKITAEINETDKSKKGYNGYAFWENQNVTEQSGPFLKRFLASIGATWEDFNKRTKMTPETTVDPSTVLSIGSVKFSGNSKVFAKITTRFERSEQYGDRTIVGRWLPKADAEDVDADEEELEDEEVLDEEDEDLEDDVELDEEDSEDDEEAELREELEALGIVALKKRAKANDSDVKLTGLKKEDVIELIVEQELLLDDEEEPEGDEEEDEGAEDELREELDGLTIAQLKQRAKANGAKVVVLKPIKDKAKLIDMIVEQELGDDEEDDNEPPF